MNTNDVFYQIYPLGMTGAPAKNDGDPSSRIRSLFPWVSYLKQLNVSAVLFNPLFESDRHGYDTRDYSKVDTRLGTNEDFAELCDAFHDAGIKVLLDAPFNHVGRGFPYFQDVIKNRESSRYKDWFYIDFSADGKDGFSYEGWEGHKELVKLNLSNRLVRNYLFARADQWIAEFGIDGLRLDAAHIMDRDFLRELAEHMHAIDPHFFLIGEIMGGDYYSLLDLGIDSATNYDLYNALTNAFENEDLRLLAETVTSQYARYGNRPLLNFADNHDVNRIASRIKEAYLPLVYALLTAVCGIPCIYYGSEWGTKGKRSAWSDKALRPAFKKPQTNDLSETVSGLNRIRRDYHIFANGDYTELYRFSSLFAFRRRNEAGQLTCILNIGNRLSSLPFDPEVREGIDLTVKKKIRFDGTFSMPGNSVYLVYSDWL